MPKCTYCGEDYEFPRGLTLVNALGHIRYFCSSKCRKYALMNRTKGKWALASKKEEDSAKEAKEKAVQ